MLHAEQESPVFRHEVRHQNRGGGSGGRRGGGRKSDQRGVVVQVLRPGLQVRAGAAGRRKELFRRRNVPSASEVRGGGGKARANVGVGASGGRCGRRRRVRAGGNRKQKRGRSEELGGRLASGQQKPEKFEHSVQTRAKLLSAGSSEARPERGRRIFLIKCFVLPLTCVCILQIGGR